MSQLDSNLDKEENVDEDQENKSAKDDNASDNIEDFFRKIK